MTARERAFRATPYTEFMGSLEFGEELEGMAYPMDMGALQMMLTGKRSKIFTVGDMLDLTEAMKGEIKKSR